MKSAYVKFKDESNNFWFFGVLISQTSKKFEIEFYKNYWRNQ